MDIGEPRVWGQHAYKERAGSQRAQLLPGHQVKQGLEWPGGPAPAEAGCPAGARGPKAFAALPGHHPPAVGEGVR